MKYALFALFSLALFSNIMVLVSGQEKLEKGKILTNGRINAILAWVCALMALSQIC